MLGAGDRLRRDRAIAAHGDPPPVRIDPPNRAKIWLCCGKRAELHRHQRRAARTSRAGRADDQRVADVADMQLVAKGVNLPSCRRAARRLENAHPLPAQPKLPRAGSWCARFSVETRAATDVGRRHGRGWSEPGLKRISTPSGIAGEVAALNHPSPPAGAFQRRDPGPRPRQ